ncbi:MAG: hypothetical protein RM022_005065 [Nostoc sp. EfeVER01]|uniref:hypothetical protein n=1 Tax=unclassified Nostoc TaxID=2593658 RepID=UPI002AD57BAC|nr:MULTISPECIES: hypothetical protein [unclassified Nostoc]MDZ7947861.1 hypothetical protein [Nostoc sp. EfeVER01]MDZ7994342.1 hypothetical protein [Nostoc sp. EspVER01]
MMLVGDSSGAQIAAAIATSIANPVYADKLGIRPALQSGPVKAALLNCRGYDINGVNYVFLRCITFC